MNKLKVKNQTMSLAKEFRDFVARGNVMDLAVGVIIGGAFGGIVTSLVNDIIMPPIGLLTGGVNFKDIKVVLREPYTDATGKLFEAVSINIGNFIQVTFNFIIIAAAVFLMVKTINQLKEDHKKKEQKEEKKVIADSKEVKLLEEIRDALVKKK